MVERLLCPFPRIVAFGGRAALTQSDGDLETTKRLLDEAIAIATDTGMRVLEARFRHRLGALLRGSGHDRAARPLLRRAIELAEGCGAESVAKEPREELKLAHGRAPQRRGLPDSLTPATARGC